MNEWMITEARPKKVVWMNEWMNEWLNDETNECMNDKGNSSRTG